MKKIFLLVFITSSLFSLTLSLNSAKNVGDTYSILHVEDNEPINCKSIPQPLDKMVYLCQFKKVVNTPINAKKMPLVNIDFLEKEKEFYIRIVPKVKSMLVPMKKSLFLSKEVDKKTDKKLFNHWSIILYKKLPYSGAIKSKEGINFPIIYPKYLTPYIGALDLNGAPISYAKSDDIKLYLDLKKSFNNGKYLNSIEDSFGIVKKYPKTIFKSEILLYRLRAIEEGNKKDISDIINEYGNNAIVAEGKQWIKSFPSDENIPEVLMLISRAYLSMGFKADANYFLDILVSEHENSSFTKKAILAFADNLYNNRNEEKALKLYKDVLYSAQNLDVAASAAIKLSDKELSRGKTEEAKKYFLKVLKANKKYLLKDRVASYDLAKKLAFNKLFDTAAQVVDVLLADMKKRDESREGILKDSGIWHAKANEIQIAYKNLQLYLSEYKNGLFTDIVQSALDELFFKLNETDESKLLAYYNKLIKKYQNRIGDKATVEKAKLLLSQEKYSSVLSMKSNLLNVGHNSSKEALGLVNSAARAITILNLKDDRCKEVVSFVENYKLDVSVFDKEKIFECLIRTSRYTKAKNLSSLHVKDKNLKTRLKWLQKQLLAQYKLTKFDKVIALGKDVVNLGKVIKQKPKLETMKMIFFAYAKKKEFNKALKITQYIEKNWKNDFKTSDIYNEIIKTGVDSRDDLLVSQYAKKLVNLQIKYKNYPFSPYVEFSYINSLKRLNKLKEALGISQKLLKVKLSSKDKTRAYYLAGELSLKLNDAKKAKDYFTQCRDVKSKSSWQDICVQNLKLL